MNLKTNLNTNSGRNFIYSVKLTAVILIFVIAFSLTSEVLTEQNDAFTRRNAFDALPANSVELMFIGNSHAFCAFIPETVEGLTRLRTYNAAMPSQVLDLTYYNLKLFLKTQSPKVIVLEAFAFQEPSGRDSFNDSNIDSMNFGLTKLSAVFNIFKKSADRKELLFRIYRHHGNWSNLSVIKSNILRLTKKISNPYAANGGYYQLDSEMSEATVQKYKNMKPEEANYKTVLSDYNIEYFNKIAQECEKRGIRLIVTMAPMNKNFTDKLNYKDIYNGFNDMCSKNGVEYVDYNILYNELNFADKDFADEFHNAHHTNINGAKKISQYMGEYIKKTMK